jgi:transposase
MLFAKVPPEASEELLQELKQTSDAKWYRRLKIIHLSSQQTPVRQLVKLFDVCAATVRDDIKRYNTGGLTTLKRQSSNGAPSKIPLSKAEWEDLLHQSPSQFERLATGARNWTQDLVVEYLAAYHEVTVTREAVSLCLKRHGVSWNRGALKVTSPDPLYTVKRKRIETLKKKAEAGSLTSHDAPEVDDTVLSKPAKPARLVFLDSTDLHWCPDVGNGYVLRGSQLRIDSPGKDNSWYALFGSLIYPDGEGVYTIHTRKRHQEVQAHLESLLDFDSEAFWIVILDNASAHTTPKLDEFLTQHQDRLKLVFQPTYSPHLNLIERLWRLMRGQMTKNQCYDCLKELAEAVVQWFEKLPFAKFCSLMGIDENQLVFVN